MTDTNGRTQTATRFFPAICAWAALALFAGLGAFAGPARAAETPAAAKPADEIDADVTQGALRVKEKDGKVVECPLKHTDVKADVSGFIARVRVTQTFFNPFKEPIEAVYVFPLPHESAVDEMTMVIGERRVVGVIKRRAEARRIYEAALAAGQTASLLEQERPNIFTQSVGNIQPGQEVRIEIGYVDVLKYDMGVYEFHFPMVVGPRYIPGSPISAKPPVGPELRGKVGEVLGPGAGGAPSGTGWSPDTSRVPDASRITPPVLKPGFRTGHDVSISVDVDAGVPIQDVKVVQHKATLKAGGPARVSAVLDRADSIPNKDFVLRYGVVGKKPEMAVLATAKKGEGGSFLLMVQPKEDEALKKAPPREVVFLIDVSGSMSGEPTEMNKRIMKKFLSMSKAEDRLQVITFAGQAQKLFEKPVPVNDETLTKALDYTQSIAGGGGTEMLKGIKMVLEEPPDPARVRIVVMLTDGFIGNEAEIIAEVGRRAGDRIRFWAVGIGSSPNRFLIDGVAKQGGGMGKAIALNEDPKDLVEEIVMRIHRAQLADVKIDWGRLAVFETYPSRVPELWTGRPIVLVGRYEDGGEDTIRISGNAEGKPVSFDVKVRLPAEEPGHAVLTKVWARRKIENLTDASCLDGSETVEEEVTKIALKHSLMSAYTSFVAVDESKKPVEGAPVPRRLAIPVPLPHGVSFKGVFGEPAAPADAMLGLAGLERAKESPDASVGVRLRYSIAAPGKASSRASGHGGGKGKKDRSRMFQAAPAMAAKMPPSAAPPAPTSTAPPGPPLSPAPLPVLKVAEAKIEMASPERDDSGYDHEESYAARLSMGMLHQDAAARAKEAKEALDAAEALRKKGDLDAARALCQHAYLLDQAALGSAGVADKALEAIEAIGKDLRALRAKTLPALEKRLDLVLKNRSLEEAVSDIGKAAGIRVTLSPESAAEVRTLLGRDALRVPYLDLRRATAAEALDWTLAAFHLEWRATADGVTAGTPHRLGLDAPWVYDVSDLALASQEELRKANPYEQTKADATGFLAAVRAVLPAKAAAVWLAPGQIIIFGGAEAHDRMGRLLAGLAKPTDEGLRAALGGTDPVPAEATALRAKTAKRAEARKAAADKARAARDGFEALGVLAASPWKILADAALRETDPEAVAALEEAYAGPALGEALKDASFAPIACRAAWALAEAAAAQPGAPEWKALAAKALAAAQAAYPPAREALEKNPEDPSAFATVLYTALARRNAAALGLVPEAEAKTRLEQDRAAMFPASAKPESPLAPMRTLASALLADSAKSVDADALGKIVFAPEPRLAGEDAILLAALSCRKAGGDLWTKFCAEQKGLLERQPLSGSGIVLLGRLSEGRLPVIQP